MAVKAALRYKPDMYRSGLEALVEGYDGTAGTGTILLPVQIVMYDDTVVTGANYQPGDPASERNITVLIEDTLRFDIATLGAMTQTQINTQLTSALNAWGQANKAAATPVGKIAYAAKRTAPVPLV